MKMDAELAAFLCSPVMIIIGTRSGDNQPEIGRAVGVMVDADTGIVDLVVSAWQWPGTIANLRDGGPVAVTFARPSDYVSYQVKGQARIRPADAHDLMCAGRYMAAIVEVLSGLGLDRRLAAPWISAAEAVVVRLHADAVYVQTPGAKAGQPVGAPQ